MPKSAPNHGAQAYAPAEDLRALLGEAELALSGSGVEATDKIMELRARLRDAIAAGRAKMQDVAAAARTLPELQIPIGQALRAVTPPDARAWFAACAYSFI